MRCITATLGVQIARSRTTGVCLAANQASAAYPSDVEPEEPDIRPRADLVVPFTIRTAATLRVADLVKDGPLSIDKLAQLCQAQPDPLGRVLRHLVQNGIFVEPERNVFGPNEASRSLESDHPSGIREFLDLDGAIGRADLALTELITQVRGVQSAYTSVFDTQFWDDLAANPELSDSFDDQMETKTRWLAPAVASAYDWNKFTHIADVGGGKGVLLAEILRSHPWLRGTLVDLPRPAEAAATYFDEMGVSDRADVVAQSYFDPLPAAEAFVLCDVLGDWDDEDAVRLLARCAEAAGAHDRILIIEMVPEGSDDPAAFTEMDIRMMVYVGGRMRDIEGIRQIAEAANLLLSEVHHLENGYCIVECLPVK